MKGGFLDSLAKGALDSRLENYLDSRLEPEKTHNIILPNKMLALPERYNVTPKLKMLTN